MKPSLKDEVYPRAVKAMTLMSYRCKGGDTKAEIVLITHVTGVVLHCLNVRSNIPNMTTASFET